MRGYNALMEESGGVEESFRAEERVRRKGKDCQVRCEKVGKKKKKRVKLEDMKERK